MVNAHSGNVNPNKFYLEMKGLYEHSLTLPSPIAGIFEGRIRKNVMLKGPSGNTWHVELVESNGRFVLQFGWKDFVTANQIDQGDILFFNYTGNFSFDVLIMGSNGCANIKSYFAKKMETQAETEVQEDSSEYTSESDSEKISTSLLDSDSSDSSDFSDDDFMDTRMKTKRVVKNGEGTSRSARNKSKREPSHESDEQKFDSKSSRESVPLIKSRKGKLNDWQKKKALQLSREVQSGNPYFVDVITKSNIQYRAIIGIPSKFRNDYKLPNEALNVKLYYKKKVWDSWYYCKNDRTVIRWMSFVRDNNLQEGDICLIELLKNPKEFSFRAHISRK